MPKKLILAIIIVCILCTAAILVITFNGNTLSNNSNNNANSNSSSNSINIPADIMAKLPPSVLTRLQKDGFNNLPSEVQAKIRKLIGETSSAQTPSKTANSDATLPTGANFSNLVPLTDLKNGTYKGYEGGLYAGGSNKPSLEYLKIGMDSAALIHPINAAGKPDNNGIIGLLTVGFSNTTMESQSFKKVSDTDPQRNSRVTVVDGAVGSRDAIELSNPDLTRYWGELQGRLDNANVKPVQVQVIWLKEVVAGDIMPFPQDAERFRDALTKIINTLKAKFPNLHSVYVSSRIYGGYALRNGSQEPWAYEGGFAYKWMIENWEKGPNPGNPWVAWGPYLWANGTTPRSDGLTWNVNEYVETDQMHPGPAATAKVATMLSDFFKTDPTTKSWYLK